MTTLDFKIVLCSNCRTEALEEETKIFKEQREMCLECYSNTTKITQRRIELVSRYGTREQKSELKAAQDLHARVLDEIKARRQPDIPPAKINAAKQPETSAINQFIKDKIHRRKKLGMVSYEKARIVFWHLLQEVIKSETGIDLTPDGITNEQKMFITNFLKWIILDPTGEIPIDKSIYLHGSNGTGKSTLVYVGQLFLEYLYSRTGNRDMLYNIISMDEAFLDIYTRDSLKSIGKLAKGFWCLDEVMPKHLSYKHYGTDHFIINDILLARHNLWKRKGTQTIIISNMTPEEFISTTPDRRIFGRVIQEYQVVCLSGKDFRKKI